MPILTIFIAHFPLDGSLRFSIMWASFFFFNFVHMVSRTTRADRSVLSLEHRISSQCSMHAIVLPSADWWLISPWAGPLQEYTVGLPHLLVYTKKKVFTLFQRFSLQCLPSNAWRNLFCWACLRLCFPGAALSTQHILIFFGSCVLSAPSPFFRKHFGSSSSAFLILVPVCRNRMSATITNLFSTLMCSRWLDQVELAKRTRTDYNGLLRMIINAPMIGHRQK